MGGNLAWTLRLDDGTQYRMDRWTNAMPELITDPDFIAGEPAAIETALESWLDMKADWEENRGTEAFRHPMTPVYAPYPFGLRPSEYGLVVTDFQTRTILSLQGYTNFGTINAVRLCYGGHAAQTFAHKVDQLEKWASKGRVARYEFTLRREDAARRLEEVGGTVAPHVHGDAWTAIVPGEVSLSDLTALCDTIRDDIPPHPEADKIAAARTAARELPEGSEEARRAFLMADALERHHAMEHDPFIFAQAVPDFAPFTLEEFDEDAEGFAALRMRVLELGFEPDAEEIAGWDERIAYLREHEDA